MSGSSFRELPDILDAENTLMLYQRYIREIPSPSVPRHWVEQLVKTLEAVLDAYAEATISMEDVKSEYFEPPDDGKGWPPEELDIDETDYEGESH